MREYKYGFTITVVMMSRQLPDAHTIVALTNDGPGGITLVPPVYL
jgi:hypothetical protein